MFGTKRAREQEDAGLAIKVFEVERTGREWVLKAHGSILSAYEDRGLAIAQATRLAASNEPSRLVVRRASGTVELERTFGYVEIHG
jgi:hypothetical protein